MKALPKTLYVTWSPSDTYFNAGTTLSPLIVGDGPTTIGVYRLEQTRRLVKRVEQSWPRQRARRRP